MAVRDRPQRGARRAAPPPAASRRWSTEPEDAVGAGRRGRAEVALRRTAVARRSAKLPAREREIVALKFHAGLSNAELARVLGVSESDAGTLLYRAMEKLRKACDATA